MFSHLPMYDLPELRAETDALFARMRQRLPALGDLRRGDHRALWQRDDLALSQVCGWDIKLGLELTVVAAPSFSLDVPPGHYRSLLVTRRAAQIECAAFNEEQSFSGNVVLRRALEGQTVRWLRTGGHRASLAALREGTCDIAAIDEVTWTLIGRVAPVELKGLTVVRALPPAPAPPFVIGNGVDANLVREAVTGLSAPELLIERIEPAQGATYQRM